MLRHYQQNPSQSKAALEAEKAGNQKAEYGGSLRQMRRRGWLHTNLRLNKGGEKAPPKQEPETTSHSEKLRLLSYNPIASFTKERANYARPFFHA